MGTPSIAEMVCRIASDFYRLGNISVLDLLRFSGYLHDPDAVLEHHLEDVLRSHPDLIEEWVKLSGDKRTGSGWYLLGPIRSDNPEWIVGYYPKGREQRCFSDRFKACAFFIKQEVEANRSYILH
jgi:hypothetical protein